MKYLKDLAKVIGFILVIYIPYVLWDIHDDLVRIEENANKDSILKLNQVKNEVNQLISDGNTLEACQKLRSEIDLQTIYFFSIKSSEAECQFPEDLNGTVEAPVKNEITKVVRAEGGDPIYIYENEIQNTKWVALASTIKINLISTDKEYTRIILWSVFKNLALVIYIVLAFCFLAILVLAKSIQNQYRKIGKDPLWLKLINKTFGWLQMHDLKILQMTTSASLKQNLSLMKDQDLLKTSLEFSILNEIKTNNQNIPYSFKGTVTKVDINGYSKIISAGQSQIAFDLTRYIEDFGCELLLRYKGLFEKTVGDEIVVVFKTVDAALLAVAFSRDLMSEISALEFDFQNEKRRFTLKSSICSSDILFSKRPSGYGFLGNALTYTSRLLDVIKDKEKNRMSCLHNEADTIKDLVQIPTDVIGFEFKNMAPTNGYILDNFYNIDLIYSAKPELIKYFRSDRDLIFLLNKVKTETDMKILDIIFNSFSDTTIKNIQESVKSAWIDSLKAFEQRVLIEVKYVFSFSQLIVEGAKLIPVEQWDQKCTDAIASISRYIDGRINASIVDVLIEKDLNHIAIEQEKSFLLDSDQSYRTRGNLIVNQAFFELSDSVFNKMIKMIKSDNELESATGIYCACRVIIYYRKENPAELETYIGFEKLTRILNDISIQKQSEISPRLQNLLKQVNYYNNLTYQETAL